MVYAAFFEMQAVFIVVHAASGMVYAAFLLEQAASFLVLDSTPSGKERYLSGSIRACSRIAAANSAGVPTSR